MKKTIMEKLGLEPKRLLNKKICMDRVRFLEKKLAKDAYKGKLRESAVYYKGWYKWLAKKGGSRKAA